MSALTGLVIKEDPDTGLMSQTLGMWLYCWQHRTAHAFPLADVERIIYTLGAAVIDDYDSGYRDGWDDKRVDAPFGKERTRQEADPPDCLLTVLPGAGDSDLYRACRTGSRVPEGGTADVTSPNRPEPEHPP